MGKRITVLGSLLAVAALGMSATAARAAIINVGSASGSPGDTVSVSVSLVAQGQMVAGTQNDITFDASAPINAKASGKPDCLVNPDILPNGDGKNGTSFGFRPPGCGGTSGIACTSVRALVLATDNTEAIGDVVMYTCKITIAAGATAGDKALVNSGIIGSDPTGTKLTGVTGTDGKVTVSGSGGNTPTPTTGGGGNTPTPTSGLSTPTPVAQCAAPRTAPPGPAVYVVDQNPAAAGTITIEVKLAAGGAMVAGTQNDLTFDPNITINTKANGHADCAVNPNILPNGDGKNGTSFGFRPPGCGGTSGIACTIVRALVLATDNVEVIPDGVTMYTCNATVTGTGGTLANSGVILSDPTGTKIAGATGQDGVICISPTGGSPTPTSLVGSSPTPTAPVISQCADPRPAPAGPAIWIVDQNLTGPAAVIVTVNLATGGAMVAGTQNDLNFDPNITINAKSNGHPDCAVNPNILPNGDGKNGTSFGFRPPGCGGTSGIVCTTVRALVLATDNVEAIPDGATMYTCNATVVNGTATLANTGIILSDPTGTKIASPTGREGIFCIPGSNTPVPTASLTAVPTTARPTVIATATASPTHSVVATVTPGITPVGGVTLASAISATDLTLVVSDATSLPDAGTIQIDDEQIGYSGKSGNTLTGLTRGVAGTVAAAHAEGAPVTLIAGATEDESGCQISTSGTHGSGWLLLLPVAAMLVIRRRSR